VLLIKADQLIDGSGDAPIRDAAVLVDGERIVQVGPAASVQAPEGAELMSAATVMPGMIDCHVHIHSPGGPVENFMAAEISELQGTSALKAWKYGMQQLNAGFTSVRSLNSPHYIDVALRNAINDGTVVGPRIRACGQGISVTGGHMDKARWSPDVFVGGRTAVGDGPWGCRVAVRQQLKYGADVIKINAAGGSLSLNPPWHQEMTYEEMAAVCEEAHWAEKRVSAHAHGGQGITDAIRAGLDSVEHAPWLSDEQIDMMVEKGVFYVPTLTVHSVGLAMGPGRTGSSPAGWRWLVKVCDDRWDTLSRAHKAGVKIAVGTDSGFWVNHGENAQELAELVQGGFTPMEAIVAATRIGAECLDLDASTGSVECGKFADLLLLDADPLADITLLQKHEHIQHVLKGGAIIR
jgi:imidazolonepropionase-like amidohydrolase